MIVSSVPLATSSPLVISLSPALTVKAPFTIDSGKLIVEVVAVDLA